MNATDSPSSEEARWKQDCLSALNDRFGWVKKQLEIHGGNLSDLKPHEQKLWYARQKAVAEFNKIGTLANAEKRLSGYKRLWVSVCP